MRHVARVLASPVGGAYSTHIDSAHCFDRHWHDTYGFGFLEHGAQGWASGRGYVRGYPGDVICTNPGELHDGSPLGAEARRWRILYMDVPTMTALTGHENHEIASPVIADKELLATLRALFARLERWNAQRDAMTSLAFEESLVASCMRLMGRHGSAPFATASPAGDVKRVRDRLADDSRAAPSLAELATLAGVSRYRVLRRFEKVYGLPPHAWLVRRRAERARVMIRRGSTLATAAAAAGFSDQSHMTRAFVRQFGFTPGAWRKAWLQ
ncbi:MAG TPA: AraC family transcriptional regulator [Gemmatimonadaceae bacterium]|nr:AraC family transcriptional regulator [Gemmatimonadaceae bacterium]